ncbi:hypothetical protein Tco_1418766 [Tanacetum coccineum]
MVYWWIGEGLTPADEDLKEEKTAEDHANDMFNELIDKDFTEPVPKNHGQYVATCKMVRAVLNMIADKISFFGFDEYGDPKDFGEFDEIESPEEIPDIYPLYFKARMILENELKNVQRSLLGMWKSSATHDIEVEEFDFNASLEHMPCELKNEQQLADFVATALGNGGHIDVYVEHHGYDIHDWFAKDNDDLEDYDEMYEIVDRGKVCASKVGRKGIQKNVYKWLSKGKDKVEEGKGGLIEHYGKLWDYRDQLLKTNPGSTVKFDVDEVSGDRHKGLKEAVREWLPLAEHRQCVRHIYANLKKSWPGLHFKSLFGGQASSTLKQSWQNCYISFIKPVSGQSMWVKTGLPPPMPPKKRVMPGRPKRKRQKHPSEVNDSSSNRGRRCRSAMQDHAKADPANADQPMFQEAEFQQPGWRWNTQPVTDFDEHGTGSTAENAFDISDE